MSCVASYWQNVDRSAGMLSSWFMSRIPFFFVRIGDGAIECLSDTQGKTCDGEPYSDTMKIAMQGAIMSLRQAHLQVIWGDWRTAVGGSTPRYVDAWESTVDVKNRRLLHYETMLLMGLSEAQHGLYRIIKRDQRRKVYIGPERNAGVDHFLACHHLTVPMDGAGLGRRGEIKRWLDEHRPEVILFGAGMAGLVEVVDYWKQERNSTCLHLGSALDPLFYQPTRSRQASRAQLQEFYGDLL
jgi:hypothetical protein